MQVETFECHETASEPIEATEEALALMEELGLTGQKALVSPKADSPAARCPYREMTKEEAFVYRVLCPKQYALKEYSRTPIPLRVLQIAAHANGLGLFKKLVVWDVADVEVKDPVLVGIMPDAEYSWMDKHFILARWGEVLEAFATLRTRAFGQKRRQFAEEVDRITTQVAAEKSRVLSMTNEEVMEHGWDARLELKFSR